jgi:uncharacterized protein
LKKKYSGILLKTVVGIILGYLFLVSGIYIFQDKIIFQAEPLPENYEFKFDQQYSEITIRPRIGKELSAILFFTNKDIRKGTILYFHGNADNLQRWGNYAVDFTKLGYNVLMIDYSGYGKSGGTPSEKVLYEDAEDTWEWAKMHLKETNFLIYGRSLGTAAAAYLATQHTPTKLIIETPFYQLLQTRLKIFFPFGLNYEFANYKFLPQISCPITIFQGTKDEIVSYNSAIKLKPLLKSTDRFITIEGGKHKNLRDFEKYHIKLAEALN